ncbi:MAG: 4-alpha-glucanotransferase [Gammaproteobacteria bacterium]|nr:4-alpha-glucanotransferase [Gammaproteobacteria bacterium]
MTMSNSPLDQRRAGVLLHPTSLPPAAHGGVLGDAACRFIDLLADAGFSVWQILPVGPVDASWSPYSSKSSFAGNARLIDLGGAAAELGAASVDGHPGSLQRAARLHGEYEEFIDRHRHWLQPWARFALLRRMHQQRPWWQWPDPARHRDAELMARLDADPRLGDLVAWQFLFDMQWRRLRSHAASRGVQLFGDLPFYTDHDSADVWAEPELFALDIHGQPREVAGVPPDYFSADGQRWGNPLYDWDGQRTALFDWWQRRLSLQASRFDLLRLDHFRALESHWAIPAACDTAREGCWRPTPGHELLGWLSERLGGLPLVAEDLGTITPEVLALRDAFDLPGMLVMQFAFDGSPDNPYLPGNHVENMVVYTGTHDNDTTLGWYRQLDERTRALVHEAIGGDGAQMPLPLIRAALASPAKLAVIPMQDLLGLGGEARMNVPGVAEGNWRWRFSWDQVARDFAQRWAENVEEFQRR